MHDPTHSNSTIYHALPPSIAEDERTIHQTTNAQVKTSRLVYLLLNIVLILTFFLPWFTPSFFGMEASELSFSPLNFYVLLLTSSILPDKIYIPCYLSATIALLFFMIAIGLFIRSIVMMTKPDIYQHRYTATGHKAMTLYLLGALVLIFQALYFNQQFNDGSYFLFSTGTTLNLMCYLFLLSAIISKVFLRRIETTLFNAEQTIRHLKSDIIITCPDCQTCFEGTRITCPSCGYKPVR